MAITWNFFKLKHMIKAATSLEVLIKNQCGLDYAKNKTFNKQTLPIFLC